MKSVNKTALQKNGGLCKSIKINSLVSKHEIPGRDTKPNNNIYQCEETKLRLKFMTLTKNILPLFFFALLLLLLAEASED